MTAVSRQVTHWHSPNFFAYFPTANSFPALLGDMLSGAIGCIGFSWVSDGGTGDPALRTWWERVAALLWDRRGTQPWRGCLPGA